MTAVELLRALERGELPGGGFHHADHLRVAWACLDECGAADAAFARLAAALRRVAASAGQPDKYSDAVTGFWICQLASIRALMPHADFDAALRACPCLLDKNLVLAYISGDVPPSRSADPPGDA